MLTVTYQNGPFQAEFKASNEAEVREAIKLWQTFQAEFFARKEEGVIS